MIERLLRDWSGENLVIRHDKPTGAWILIAIHSTLLGPATGGTRMTQYPDLDAAIGDALRLAEGMTYKFAVPGFPRGGGKAVIFAPENLDTRSRSGLLRRYGKLIYQMGGLFYTGPDVGTSPSDMDTISETGAPYVHSRTPAAGGAGSSGPFTALGVFTGIKVACASLFGEDSLKGRRVLVQGAGSVGAVLIDLLLKAGAEVMFSETDQELVKHYREDLGLEFVPPDLVSTTDCDVFSPCALGNVLNADTIPKLKCRVVAGGANNQLSSLEDAEALRARGIFYAPDYVLSVGGAMAITGMESLDWTREEAEIQVTSSIEKALLRIIDLTVSENITTEAAARLIAEEHLAKAK